MLLVTAAGLAAQRGTSTIRVEVITVPVTVLDNRNRFVQGLKQTDFEVLEDGAPQDITSFAVTESGVTAELLIDTSGSMTSRLPDVKRAAIEFIRQMRMNDVTKISQFDDTIKPLIDFSSDKAALEQAIGTAKIGGETAMYNALWRALGDLQRRKETDEASRRHRAIVLLTDGEDTGSAVTAEEVMTQARRADVLVYCLSLDRPNGAPPAEDSTAAIFLRELADQTGGRPFFTVVGELPKLYRQLSDELRNQYVLGYVPSSVNARGRWRSITVHVKNRNNLRLRHRLGYFSTNVRSGP
jgi:Ca-activated chloride channel family protein